MFAQSFISNAVNLASHGLSFIDPEFAKNAALTVVRVGTGAFFACSGYNKLTDKDRHAAMIETFKRDHVPFITFNQWWVPIWEFVAGSMLVVGLGASFFAAVLAIICCVAAVCEAPLRVSEFKPINREDVLADYLYLPEILYLFLLAVNIIAGTGAWSLDALLRSYL